MMYQNRVSLRESLYTLSLLVLLALFGTGFLGNITAVHAQAAAICGGQDTNEVQDQTSAETTPEPNCPENKGTDAVACIVFGAVTAESTAAPEVGGQEIQDQAGTEANGQEVQDQTGSGEQAGEDNTADAGKAGNQVQDPAYVGSLKVDETALQTLPDAGRCNALKTMAKITVEAAQAAVLKADPTSVVDTIELDVENGYLVYGVQLKDGSEVKVDAGNASILATQAADSTN